MSAIGVRFSEVTLAEFIAAGNSVIKFLTALV